MEGIFVFESASLTGLFDGRAMIDFVRMIHVRERVTNKLYDH